MPLEVSVCAVKVHRLGEYLMVPTGELEMRQYPSISENRVVVKAAKSEHIIITNFHKPYGRFGDRVVKLSDWTYSFDIFTRFTKFDPKGQATPTYTIKVDFHLYRPFGKAVHVTETVGPSLGLAQMNIAPNYWYTKVGGKCRMVSMFARIGH